MAARSDNDIKSDVITELEDIVYDEESGRSILDAFIVEQVKVDSGRVDVLLAFDDDTPEARREAIVESIRDNADDVEGLIFLVVDHIDRSELVAREPTLVHPRPAGLAAPAPPPAEEVPVAPASGGLSLSSLISSAAEQAMAEGVTMDDLATPGFELGVGGGGAAPAPSGLTVYSGGGCGVGTVGTPYTAAEPEPVRSAAPAPAASPEPAPKANGRAPEETALAPVRAESVAAADGAVTVSLQRYTDLVRAERTVELLPSLEDYLALQRENAALKARLSALESLLGR